MQFSQHSWGCISEHFPVKCIYSSILPSASNSSHWGIMKCNICNTVLGACKVILQVRCLFGRIILLFLQCFLMYFFPLCQVTQLFFFFPLKLLKTFLAITPTLNTLFKLTPIKHRLLHSFSMFWLPVFMYYLTSFQNQVLTKIKGKYKNTAGNSNHSQ